MPMYETKYTVEGVPPIPLDMLRYDGAYPATEQDAGRGGLSASEHDGTPVKVELIHREWGAGWRGPTSDRWKSFLWRVVSVEPARKLW